MRIVCEKCAAKYSVDDRLITPRGVRALCPRCRHAQLIRRVDPEIPPASATPSAPAPSPGSRASPAAAETSSAGVYGSASTPAPPAPPANKDPSASAAQTNPLPGKTRTD